MWSYSIWEKVVEITSRLNKYLERACESTGLAFRSIFQLMMDNQYYEGKRYYSDPIHLGPASLPFVFNELKDFLPDPE